MGTVLLGLMREAGFEFQRRPFEILLDGTVVGSAARRESVELPVESGHRTLRLRSGRALSPERSFAAVEGKVINFSCHSARVWPIYVASLFKPDWGISLKQVRARGSEDT